MTKTTEKIKLKPIAKRRMTFGIRGISPLIMHQWSEKAKRQMRDKQQDAKKTTEREKRDPITEAKAATYVDDFEQVGIPGMAFKSALVSAAHKDLGIEKTLVRKAIFLVTKDSNKILPIEGSEPVIREDMVRVGAGSADMRYRPEIAEWSCFIELEVDSELLQRDDVLSLVNRAGFGVGICEWRPEKGGEFGRFEIDPNVPVSFEA